MKISLPEIGFLETHTLAKNPVLHLKFISINKVETRFFDYYR